MLTTATRHHDISVGHRVLGSNKKCARLHGHNYRIHFELASTKPLRENVIMDFAAMKSIFCEWLEKWWDHRFLVSRGDLWCDALCAIDKSVKIVGFNPTAENMAAYLLNEICPSLIRSNGLNVTIRKVTVEETRKCSASCEVTL